ncbi:hypothetical protein HK099_003284, partial [Clydaea vesicula]
KGNIVIVVDNEDRENEGDFVIAAEDMTTEKMAFFVRYSGGVICIPALSSRLDELNLPMMVNNNEDTFRTAYTVSVDYKHGTTTGISAHDRALTCRSIAQPSKTTMSNDFRRPGHCFPLRYTEGGVLKRIGHTEASVDLCILAGKNPCAAISEVVSVKNENFEFLKSQNGSVYLENNSNDEIGSMARRNELYSLSRMWGIKMISISDLRQYRVENNC